jgi:hypothetical protein
MDEAAFASSACAGDRNRSSAAAKRQGVTRDGDPHDGAPTLLFIADAVADATAIRAASAVRGLDVTAASAV